MMCSGEGIWDIIFIEVYFSWWIGNEMIDFFWYLCCDDVLFFFIVNFFDLYYGFGVLVEYVEWYDV